MLRRSRHIRPVAAAALLACAALAGVTAALASAASRAATTTTTATATTTTTPAVPTTTTTCTHLTSAVKGNFFCLTVVANGLAVSSFTAERHYKPEQNSVAVPPICNYQAQVTVQKSNGTHYWEKASKVHPKCTATANTGVIKKTFSVAGVTFTNRSAVCATWFESPDTSVKASQYAKVCVQIHS